MVQAGRNRGARARSAGGGPCSVAAALRPLGRAGAGEVAVSAPRGEAGWWAGAPSAVLIKGTIWVAYRLRAPVDSGRGYATVVARSRDGESLETVAVVSRDSLGAASLERPALLVTPQGRWRLYLSVATPGTAHWQVVLLEAATPELLPAASPRIAMPGDPARLAVKDPVIQRRGEHWHAWASVHPLQDPWSTDRMWTEHAVSADGIEWDWQGPALTGRTGCRDARGARITSVHLDGTTALATYDGRASAAENWQERTGIAASPAGVLGNGAGLPGMFTACGRSPAAWSAKGVGGALRYLSFVPAGRGYLRCYFESGRADGAHDLRTMVVRDFTMDRHAWEEPCPCPDS